jgi:Fe-S-cluster-containing hydrogenase component 2
MYLSVGSWLCVVMCPSGRVVVVFSYVPFWKRDGGRQLCDLLLGGWW